MLRRLIAVAFFGLAASLILLSIPPSQPAMANNERGRKLYVQYCASCHGFDGKGHGPVAESLCKPLPDLTRIEKKDGKFPGLRISLVIAGEVGVTELTSHGTRDMPVWGRHFRTVKGDSGVARLDVYALTKYIEAIQQP
jgi:mono/diheme cytochrome c family protein